MFKCNECGAVFEEEGVFQNPLPYGAQIVYEEFTCCPSCGGGMYDEVKEGEDDDEYDDENET